MVESYDGMAGAPTWSELASRASRVVRSRLAPNPVDDITVQEFVPVPAFEYDGHYDGVAGIEGLGLSLKPPKIVRKIGKAVGKVVDNKVVKGIVATGLAVTGVGIPASAAIVGGMSAAGKAAQGKRIGTIAKGAAAGAAVGAAAGVAGKLLPKVPVLGKQVTKLRDTDAVRKVTRRPSRADEQASRVEEIVKRTPLPSVKRTPSTVTTVEPSVATTMPVVEETPTVLTKTATAVEKAAEVTRNRSVRERVQRAMKRAQDIVEGKPDGTPVAVVPPPSGGGEGGVAVPEQASMLANPMVLLAGAGLLLLATRGGSGVAVQRRGR